MAIEQVEPANCTLWQYHHRCGEDLGDATCRELTASMRLHGQRHPVLGRRLEGAETAVELIYGGRRLFAATRLGIKLLVDIQVLDDRAAIVAMEIENRLRTDVSPYERGMSYRRWLNARIFRSQSELAQELGVSEAQVSKLLRYAELPSAVVSAFESPSSIREEWAVTLAKLCQDPRRRPALLRRARDAARNEQRYSPRLIFRQLTSEENLRESTRPGTCDEVVKSSSGEPIYRIAVRANAVHFILPRAALSDDLVQQLRHQVTCVFEEVARMQAYAHPPFRQLINRPRSSEEKAVRL